MRYYSKHRVKNHLHAQGSLMCADLQRKIWALVALRASKRVIAAMKIHYANCMEVARYVYKTLLIHHGTVMRVYECKHNTDAMNVEGKTVSRRPRLASRSVRLLDMCAHVIDRRRQIVMLAADPVIRHLVMFDASSMGQLCPPASGTYIFVHGHQTFP